MLRTARGYQILNERRLGCQVAGVGGDCCAACSRGATCEGGNVTVHLSHGDQAPPLVTPDEPPTNASPCVPPASGMPNEPPSGCPGDCVPPAAGMRYAGAGDLRYGEVSVPTHLPSTPSTVRQGWALVASSIPTVGPAQPVSQYVFADVLPFLRKQPTGSGPVPVPAGATWQTGTMYGTTWALETAPAGRSPSPALPNWYLYAYGGLPTTTSMTPVHYTLPATTTRYAGAGARTKQDRADGVGDLPSLQTILTGLQGAQTADGASAFLSTIAAGTAYKMAGDAGVAGQYDSAVDAYKAAGQAAVSSTGIGGELAAADSTGTATTYTQQAWAINAQLNSSAVNSTQSTGKAATQSDAQQAQGYVTQMLNFYLKGVQAAITANMTQPPVTPVAPVTPATPVTPVTPVTPLPVTPVVPTSPVQSSTNYATPILVGASVVGAALIGTALYRRYYGHGGSKRGSMKLLPA